MDGKIKKKNLKSNSLPDGAMVGVIYMMSH